MPVFFLSDSGANGQIGRTVGCPDKSAQGSVRMVTMKPEVDWSTHTSIITRIAISQHGNFQFLHTIGNDVYVYVFGDRMGRVTISGLSMTQDFTKANDLKHGFEKIYKWYAENRIAMRQEPVSVTIGNDTNFEGFVVGLTGDAIDPATRLIQFGLQIAVLPEKR